MEHGGNVFIRPRRRRRPRESLGRITGQFSRATGRLSSLPLSPLDSEARGCVRKATRAVVACALQSEGGFAPLMLEIGVARALPWRIQICYIGCIYGWSTLTFPNASKASEKLVVVYIGNRR